MTQYCIIPARGGSKRIPGKNMKQFFGQPIIQYSINAARAISLFQEIIVSSDDPDTIAYANRQGCKVHYRGEHFSQDEIGTQEVAANVIKEMGIQPDSVVCVLYPCSPLIDIDYLKQGMYQLFQQSLVMDKRYVYSTDMDGNDAGNFYWGFAESFIKQIPLEGHSEFIMMEDERICDINTEGDWERAKKMYMHLKNKLEQENG